MEHRVRSADRGLSPTTSSECMCWGVLTPLYEVLKVAKQARAAGIRTAVLSSLWDASHTTPTRRTTCAATSMRSCCRANTAYASPILAIFRLALERLGLTAGQCVFVDDSEENLQAASDLGMTIVFSLDERVVAQRLRMLFGLSDL